MFEIGPRAIIEEIFKKEVVRNGTLVGFDLVRHTPFVIAVAEDNFIFHNLNEKKSRYKLILEDYSRGGEKKIWVLSLKGLAIELEEPYSLMNEEKKLRLSMKPTGFSFPDQEIHCIDQVYVGKDEIIKGLRQNGSKMGLYAELIERGELVVDKNWFQIGFSRLAERPVVRFKQRKYHSY